MAKKPPEFIKKIDTDKAEIAEINRSACLLSIPTFLDSAVIEVGQVPAICYVRLAREITDEERNGLREAILAISPLLEEVQLIGGVAPWKEFPGKVWKIRGEFGVRVEDAPVESPPE